MSARSGMISKLINSFSSRVAYTKSTVGINITSQILALRKRRGLTQEDLATEAGMKQPRISAMERPGALVSVDTLIRLASAFKVGLVVKFVPFSEMLKWENSYSQDSFNATVIEEDKEFLEPRETAASSGLVEIEEDAFNTIGDHDLTLDHPYQPQTPSWIFHGGGLTQAATATATNAQSIWLTR